MLELKKTHKIDIHTKHVLSILFILFIVSASGDVQGYLTFNTSQTPSHYFKTSIQRTIEIPPGSDYSIKLDPDTFSFQEIGCPVETEGWTDAMIAAIVKSPTWLHRDLIRQFKHLENKSIYADLLLNAKKHMTDELAFSIAYSPLGRVASPDVLLKNVQWLYLIDKDIQYAEIIDDNTTDGDYYSTVRYTVLENGSEKTYEYPPEIYYWFIVHPEILGEHAQMMYDTFWRQFLYTHNDLGYPLLKETIEHIDFLWDKESYSQPARRIWREWIHAHPTAIEACSYWIGKTVPFLATGDRPIQPNLIAHEHNGYCGELQRLAVAVQRTLLIPSIGACNLAEDHVWREFYDHGWHQNDNWWADTGGCVDVPYVYTDGWGKDMSTIYAVKGDGCIVDRTAMYLHKDERVTVNFTVYDGFFNPYDGAQITVFVKGMKDITWYQYKVLEFLENLWMNLSTLFNDTIVETWYNKIRERIMTLPEVVDGPIITIWNYTDINGFCSFNLGKNDEYFFLIQNPDGLFPWPLRAHNAIRWMKNPKDTHFQMRLKDFSEKPLKYTLKESQGDYTAELSYNVSWWQFQQHIRTKDVGIHRYPGDIEVFYVDEQNYERYQKGRAFTAYIPEIVNEQREEIIFDSTLYMVFVNKAHHSSAIIDLSASMRGQTLDTYLSFDMPQSSLFKEPTYHIGDHIKLSGSATDTSQLSIENTTISFPSGPWTYYWNTSGLSSGVYTVQLICQSETREKIIRLIDRTPPDIMINTPVHHQIFDQSEPTIYCSGIVSDASQIASIEININETFNERFEHTNHWEFSFNPALLSPGVHRITCKAVDSSENSATKSLDIVIVNETSNHQPVITNISSKIKREGNWTSVTIFVNATASPLYPLNELKVYYQNDSGTYIKKMYPYASNPEIPRHVEDPFRNQTNKPIYGCFLGDFYTGETIAYWIEVIDVSGRTNTTSKMMLEL